MRLLVLSDLHIEHAAFKAPVEGFDVVVLAGDIHNGVHAITWARESFPHSPIVQVAGNHEFFGGVRPQVLDDMRQAASQHQVYFLENQSIEINGVRFLGSTLWTNYKVFEKPGRAFAMPSAQVQQANLRLIADYSKILESPQQRFSPEHSVLLFNQAHAWLVSELNKPAQLSTVVVTHHLPSWQSVAPAFSQSLTNGAFVSDLDDLVAKADIWIHGHTHSSHHYQIGHTEVVANPRGYPWRGGLTEFENPQFLPKKILVI
jgi:predicted phosphodiesterase